MSDTQTSSKIKKFYALRKPLQENEKYFKTRYLDPGNLKSPKKDFYNSTVLLIFDKYYTKK